MGSPEKTQHAIRRSTRLPLEVPVRVTSLDAAQPFSEQCNTTLVNAHGCGLIVSRVLAHGIQVRLEIVSAKRHTTARVSEVVPLGGDPETWLVGLELDVPGNFWGIEYAPSDWKVEENLSPAANRRRRRAARRSRAERDGEAGSCATLAPDRHQRGRLLPGDGRAFSRRYSGVAEYSGDEHGVFARRSGTGVACANGNGSRVHGNTSARSAGTSGGADWPADERSRGSENFRGEKRTPKESQRAAPKHAPEAAQDDESPDPLLGLVREGPSLTAEQFLNDLRAQRLGKRRDPRIDLALPVMLTGTDSSGRPLDQRVITINISRRGALLDGIHGMLGPGDKISLARGHKKEEFRVAWVGGDDTPAAGQIGVAAVDPNTSFWSEVLEATAKSGLETASVRGNSGGTRQ